MSSSQRSAGFGPVLSAFGPVRLGAVLLITVIGLAGCASVQPGATAGAGSGSGSGSVSASGSGPAVSPSATGGSAGGPASAPGGVLPPSASGGAANPGGPISAPENQVAQVPAGGKLIGFEGVSKSSDGMTVYLSAMSAGGACGQYDVVVQESSTTVKLGLVNIPPGKTVPCPMFVRNAVFPAHLASALGDRQVIDLANGQSVGTGSTIPLVSSGAPKLPQ